MSLLIQYLVKLSISLTIVWLFYQFILRRLTFYNSNRWYLLGYSLLSFYIPFINISFILGDRNGVENDFIQFIPAVHKYTIALEEATHCPIPIWSTQYDKWDWIAFALITGVGFLLLRFIIRYISFLRIKSKSKLISNEGIKVYQVNEQIIPFSFGNAVFINPNLHSEAELKEIVLHEFIHVRQNHTFDIIWAELLCILNWYNPFAWLLRRSIRQNLEFIADSKVVENGLNKKEYQYLLLKVIGNSQFSIATQFNFSSLKKRIAMMNKTKSARRQMVRFLFLLPVFAIILLSFRKTFTDSSHTRTGVRSTVFTDTIPEVKEPNNKGYLIDIKGIKGNCTVVVKDKNKKEVTRLLLTEWNEKADYYENLYGEIPAVPVSGLKEVVVVGKSMPANSLREVVVAGEAITGTQVKTETVEGFPIAESAIPTIVVSGHLSTTDPLSPVKVIGVKPKNNVTADFDLDGDLITVTQKNGTKESFNLKNEKEKQLFTDKYGEPVLVTDISTAVNSNVNSEVAALATTTVNSNVNLNTMPAISGKLATTIASPVVVNTNVSDITSTNINTNIDFDIVVTILKTTTEVELDKLITKLKEKGYELKFTNKNYKDGVLTNIGGTVKYKGSSSTFSATDFNDLTIAVFHDGDEVGFKILTNMSKLKKEVI